MADILEVRDLRVVFGEGASAFTAVNGASLSVAEGETYGLVGESGSGKSTILRAIAGLNSMAGGKILLEGRELPTPRTMDFYRKAQMVFQDPYDSLHPRQTIWSQLMEPVKIHRLADGEKRGAAILDAVGLGKAFRWRYPHQLSGGQRQRVAIARALMLEPPILLLDEPTSALDVSVQAEILNLLKDLQETRGLTYLIVSHDLGVISHMCRRTAVMQNGRLVEELSIESLREGKAEKEYTRRLLGASVAYGEDASTAAQAAG